MGSAFPQREEQTISARGRDLVSGLPRTVRMTSTEIREAMAEPIAGIVEAVKMTLERTPPELVADTIDRGIVMVGGGSLLRGLDRLLAGMPVTLADDPLGSVVLGTVGAARGDRDPEEGAHHEQEVLEGAVLLDVFVRRRRFVVFVALCLLCSRCTHRSGAVPRKAPDRVAPCSGHSFRAKSPSISNENASSRN